MSKKTANCYTCKEDIPGSTFTIDPQNCSECRQKLIEAREKQKTPSQREKEEKAYEELQSFSRYMRGENR